ncbi:MAG: TRAP transporter small permease [Desulfovibrio sp.]|jgi:TRAP-type C4-dicarboxylate transport system permease small subunit|nr:TRAP transporter small permease [Desulfovibrio sp.]
MPTYKKVVKRIADAVLRISILCFLLMMFCGGAQVVSRYVFNMSLDWTEEVARFMFIISSLLGAALCFRSMGHVRVDLVVMRLSARMQRQIALLVLVADAALFTVMLGFGVVIAWVTMGQVAPATEIPMGLVYAVVPISGLLMLLFLVEQMLDIVFQKDNAAPTKERTTS